MGADRFSSPGGILTYQRRLSWSLRGMFWVRILVPADAQRVVLKAQ